MTQNYNLNPYNTSFFKVLNLLCCFRLVNMLTSIIKMFLGSWMIYPWESSTIIMSSFSWIMWNPFLSTVSSATWSLTFYSVLLLLIWSVLWPAMNALAMVSSLEISPNNFRILNNPFWFIASFFGNLDSKHSLLLIIMSIGWVWRNFLFLLRFKLSIDTLCKCFILFFETV